MKNYILPLRDIVVHPGLTMPIYLDIPTSVDCLKTASNFGNQIILVPQRSWGYPTDVDDLYDVGTIGNIVQILNLPDGSVHSIVRTTDAVKISDVQMVDGLFVGNAEKIEIADDMESEQTLALRDKIIENLRGLTTPKKIKMEKLYNVVRNYPLPAFIDSIIQTLNIDTDTALKILSATSWQQKLIILLEQVSLSAETAKIEENINTRVRQQMESGRRDAILQEKLRAIQHEMGEDDETADTNNMRKKIENANLPADVLDKAKSEWKRMRTMSPMSQEGGLIKNYLDELLSMPWGHFDQQPIDLKRARETLDAEHSGMQPVKERILEHIAVMKKTGSPRGSILCFVGAPGVGKTSLCKSIANALGRKYQRISLGGISDESHFRGHRKTYIGAQTGRIMDALKRCKTNNPVIVLDEIDKMESDGTFDLLPKKEVINIKKEYEKLNKNLRGIREMKRLPQALVIVDPRKEENAIKEARILGIPVFGVVDTNCDPDLVDYVIPGNDDAVRSVKLLIGALTNAIAEVNGNEVIDYVTEDDKNKSEKRENKNFKKDVKKEDKKEEKVEAPKKEETKDFASMTVAELKEEAKKAGIKGSTTMKKAELVEALSK